MTDRNGWCVAYSRITHSLLEGRRKMIKVLPITVEVDARIAKAYTGASKEEQRKLGALLSLRLGEVIHAQRSLEDVMRDMSSKAQARGLTMEILEELLQEE